MDDNNNISLTLEPENNAGVAAPDFGLTLNPVQSPSLETQTLQQQEEAEKAKKREANAVKLDESMLTEAERKVVEEFSQKIDITDSNQVMSYGSSAQKNIASFSESALKNVKTQDLGEIGEDLSALVVQLKTMNEEEKKGLMGFFQKKKRDLEALKASYAKAEVNVDKIVDKLESHQVTLMKDIAMFDQMYDLNLKYYKELTMYII
ncbi:MAG: toxic anion resistance protein, partial [Lachnospiraceae bacterium]|nr:toxic anion resistance protein [Lachnospiraceae bacterium]